MANEFDDIKEGDAGIKEDDFDTPASEVFGGDKELMPQDMERSAFIKNPEVGQSVLLEVEKVVKSDRTEAKNKTSGEMFNIGLKNKKGDITRIDLICKAGRYTVNNWEIFFKLFGVDGLLNQYGKKHKTFAGAQIRITKHFNGQYASMKPEMVAKLLDMTVEKAKVYTAEVGKAMKERKLYTVEVLNL